MERAVESVGPYKKYNFTRSLSIVTAGTAARTTVPAPPNYMEKQSTGAFHAPVLFCAKCPAQFSILNSQFSIRSRRNSPFSEGAVSEADWGSVLLKIGYSLRPRCRSATSLKAGGIFCPPLQKTFPVCHCEGAFCARGNLPEQTGCQ